MFTPAWYAVRVMALTANNWWENGEPPMRGRHLRAANAVAQAAAGIARRLHRARGLVLR